MVYPPERKGTRDWRNADYYLSKLFLKVLRKKNEPFQYWGGVRASIVFKKGLGDFSRGGRLRHSEKSRGGIPWCR